MSETPSPKAPKRSKRKPPMEPLGWDEIVSQPGMGGYLSFLNGPVALPHLTPAATPDPEVEPAPNTPAVETTPEPVSDEKPPGAEKPAALKTASGVESSSVPIPTRLPVSAPEVDSPTHTLLTPGLKSAPEVNAPPHPLTSPALTSAPEVDSSPLSPQPPLISGPRRPRIRRCFAAQDGHSLGEEVLYQALWKAAQPESPETRTIVVGWRGMSQLCRMTPKNCKINAQRLLRKLALEILSPYNTPESIGTTYRVFSSEAILRRRSEAGFEWVIRSRGVEFVNPATGAIMPICAATP